MLSVYIQEDIPQTNKNLIQKTKNLLVKYIYTGWTISLFSRKTMKLNFKAVLFKVPCRVQIWYKTFFSSK